MDISVSNQTIPGPHGPIPIRSYTSTSASPVCGLVWLHGGAFKYGDLDIPEADWVSRELAQSGIAVVSVDYRLAVNDVRFPVPSDDVLTVWRWATTEQPFGVPASGWSIGGASAGGNLAASVSLQCRDGQGVLPRTSVFVYPVMHSTLPSPTPDLATRLASLPSELRFTSELTHELNLNYVGDESLLTHPYAFPGYGSFISLPPTLVINADTDDLRPSGETYADALSHAGVPVTIVHEPDTTHGYLNDITHPATTRTVRRVHDWLAEHNLSR